MREWLKNMNSLLVAKELRTLPVPIIRPPTKTTARAENRRLRAFDKGPAIQHTQYRRYAMMAIMYYCNRMQRQSM